MPSPSRLRTVLLALGVVVGMLAALPSVPAGALGLPVLMVGGPYGDVRGVATESDGDIVVATVYAVQRVTPAGESTSLYSGSSQLWGVATGVDSDVYVSMPWDGVVRRIAADGTVSDFATNLGFPLGVAVATTGEVGVVDQAGTVRIFDPDGTLQDSFVPVHDEDLHGIAFDHHGGLWITGLVRGSDPQTMRLHHVQRSAPHTTTTELVSTRTRGLGVAVDSEDILYVTQSPQSTESASDGSIVRFTPDGRSDVFASGLGFPVAVAVSPDGSVYESDNVFGSLNAIPQPFGIRYRALGPVTRGVPSTPVQLVALGVTPSSAPLSTVVKFKKVSLPKGLRVSAGGVLSGTPSAKLAPGSYTLTVSVGEVVTTLVGARRVKERASATRTFTLVID